MSKAQRIRLFALAGILAALTFVADAMLPLGIAMGVPYVVLVLLAWWLLKYSHIFVFAAIASALIVAGYYASPEGGIAWMVHMNRLLAVGAVWMTAGLLFMARRHWQAREDSHRQLQGILDYSPISISLKDRKGRYKKATRHHKETMGIEPEAMIGKTVYELYEPAVARQVVAGDRKALDTRAPVRGEEITIKVDGIPRHFLATKFPILDADGEPEEVCSTHIEITDLVRSREALRDTYNLLRGVADGIPALVAYVDRQETYQFANKTYEEWFGLVALGIIGLRIRDVIGEANYGIVKPHIDIAMTGKRQKFESTIVLRVKGLRYIEINYIPDFDVENKVRGLFILALDITDRKRDEVALLRAKKDADEANEAKTRFLAAASHDLRQPLQAAALYAHLLSEHQQDAKSRELFKGLQGSLAAGTDELNTLLDVSRLKEGAIKPEWTQFPAETLLQRMKRGFEEEARKRRIDFRVLASNATIRSDASLLSTMLRNLISNAIKYTPQNGRVLVGCRHKEGRLSIEILDTGPGIPEKKQGAIFEEFYQIENPERDREQGVGLGLAIVKRTAELLGHSIDVTSEVGKGTRFAIEVPTVAMAVSEGVPTVREEDQRVDKLGFPFLGARVLVIEDDPIVRGAVAVLLENWGCHVTSAATAEEAWRRLSTLHLVPDLVIADYWLPNGLSGMKAIETLQHNIGKAIPSIILTGDTTGEVDREISSKGFHLLQKPVSAELLKDCLVYMLSQQAN